MIGLAPDAKESIYE